MKEIKQEYEIQEQDIEEYEDEIGDDYDEDQDNEEQYSEEREEKQIQNQLSHIPFATLLKLRAQEQPKEKQKEKQIKEKSQQIKQKRTDKSAPLMRDARKPLPSQEFTIKEKKFERRDPRFENLSGKLSLDRFSNNYKFIEEMRVKEKKVLERQIKSKRIGKEKKQKLKNWLGKIKSEQKQKENLDQKMRIKKQLTGDTYHAKKSQFKEQILLEKYQKLKSEGKLNSFMANKKIRQQEKLDIAYRKINRN